ncbi:MAG: NUDIX domain-containing protein [Candidatus Andersenbacteria bacterium]|nr:NUDIX domain-containing protein [bacterium]MDZ4225603.1 NUDIX domain-containing protein [Candidatus Andersenbacteria bacterium]
MKAYTLGFIFSHDLLKVLLMHKNRPDWQAGKLNGIGGRIERGEESSDCIVREVKEEAGVKTKKKDWKYFGKLKAKGWRVDLYAIVYKGDTNDFSTTTDEEIEWFEADDLPDGGIEGLS